jgi:hypothetical protein
MKGCEECAGERSEGAYFFKLLLLMTSQEVRKRPCPSFRQKPESSVSKDLRNTWIPFFNGVTTSYEAVIIDRILMEKGVMVKTKGAISSGNILPKSII